MFDEMYRKLRLDGCTHFKVIGAPEGVEIASKIPSDIRLAGDNEQSDNTLVFADHIEKLNDLLETVLKDLPHNAVLTCAFPHDMMAKFSRRYTELSSITEKGFRWIAQFDLLPGYRAVRFVRREQVGRSVKTDMQQLERNSAALRSRYFQSA